MALENLNSDQPVFHDVLVLDGGSTEALAYHIGFVCTMISTGRFGILRQVIGTGYSALLAWRLAKTWRRVLAIYSESSERAERNGKLIALLSSPLNDFLLAPTTKWRLLIDKLAREDKVASEETHDDGDSKDSESDFHLVPGVTFTVARAVCDSTAVWVARNGADEDLVLAAMELANYDSAIGFGAYSNIWTAMRTECTISGTGVRFLVSSKSAESEPNTKLQRIEGDDLVVFPMHFQIAETARALSSSVLDAGTLQRYRRLGRESIIDSVVVRTDGKKATSIMATPRKAPNQYPGSAKKKKQHAEQEIAPDTERLARPKQRCSAPCSSLSSFFFSSGVVIKRVEL